MILSIVSSITILIGYFISHFSSKRKKNEKVSVVLMVFGYASLFIVFIHMFLINEALPIEIKETSYELIQFENGSYIENRGKDAYVKAKVSKDKTKSIMLRKGTLMINNDNSPPFIKIKKNVYPEWYKIVFIEEMYPEEYEIHI